MSFPQLHSQLPIIGWKRIEALTEAQANDMTDGHCEYMSNKDYWTLDGIRSQRSNIPEGNRAVYKHDGCWFVVKRV